MSRPFPKALPTRPVPDNPVPPAADTKRASGGAQARITVARARIVPDGSLQDGARHRRKEAED